MTSKFTVNLYKWQTNEILIRSWILLNFLIKKKVKKKKQTQKHNAVYANRNVEGAL